jgi:hypothetical protein
MVLDRWIGAIIFHILKVPEQLTDQLISSVQTRLTFSVRKRVAASHIQPATPPFSLDAAGLVALADLTTV